MILVNLFFRMGLDFNVEEVLGRVIMYLFIVIGRK